MALVRAPNHISSSFVYSYTVRAGQGLKKKPRMRSVSQFFGGGRALEIFSKTRILLVSFGYNQGVVTREILGIHQRERAVKWNSAFSVPTHFGTQPRTESRVRC
jgi:hypothetical protein